MLLFSQETRPGQKTGCVGCEHWAYLSVEMQDMCLVESQDICFVETQDMCCVETVAKDTTGSQPSPAGRVQRSKNEGKPW